MDDVDPFSSHDGGDLCYPRWSRAVFQGVRGQEAKAAHADIFHEGAWHTVNDRLVAGCYYTGGQIYSVDLASSDCKIMRIYKNAQYYISRFG
ncbi:hypothetical protein ASD64_02885 [Mesorhizobium sp. Root157]|nr:hypothetical protein ASD64_02885 [Mesorhizobium sp. Root157]